MAVAHVALGPVSSASVLAWAESARRTLAVVRARPDFGVPAEIVERFDQLVDEWAGAASAGDTFEWSAEMDLAEVRRLSTQWLRLANLAREPGSGIHPAPPEGQEFYDALAVAMLTATEMEDDPERLGSKFDEMLPDFDARQPISRDVQVDGAVRSVLLVDDTEDIRMLFRLALDLDPRFEIFGEAANGEEAIAACESACPDLVLLDVMMPVMNGLEALPLLRKRCPSAIVVMLSADDRKETRETALRLGAFAFLAKTTSIEEVRSLLAAA